MGEHSDRQRGDTVSGFRFASFGTAALLVRTDKLMCVSLCRYRSVLVLPVTMRSTHPPSILVYTWDRLGNAVEALLPYAAVDSPNWSRLGLLDVVVTGLKNGVVLCGRRADSKRPGMGTAKNAELTALSPS